MQGRHTPCAPGFPLPAVVQVSIEFGKRGSCCSLEVWLAAARLAGVHLEVGNPDEHLPTDRVLAGFGALVRATMGGWDAAPRHLCERAPVLQAQAQGKGGAQRPAQGSRTRPHPLLVSRWRQTVLGLRPTRALEAWSRSGQGFKLCSPILSNVIPPFDTAAVGLRCVG